MTRNQLILQTSVEVCNALCQDDNLANLEPQEAINQYFKYLDTIVPAMKTRLEYYEKQYQLDVKVGTAEDEESTLGKAVSAVPGILEKLPEIISLISSFKGNT